MVGCVHALGSFCSKVVRWAPAHGSAVLAPKALGGSWAAIGQGMGVPGRAGERKLVPRSFPL